MPSPYRLCSFFPSMQSRTNSFAQIYSTGLLAALSISSVMASAFHQTQGVAWQTTNSQIYKQVERSMALQIDAPMVTATIPEQPTVAQPATRINYPAYNPGYNPGTLIEYQLPATANPPPVPNQHAITSSHTYQAFSVTDLPPLLFRLEAYQDRFVDSQTNEDIPVPMMYDSITRTPMINSRSAPLRYFSFLPRYIAQDVPGCLLEFWFRLDYRLEMNDIAMRMERNPSGNIPANNTFNMRRVRFRNSINADSWGSSRSWPVKTDIAHLDRCSAQQICLNTTMIVDLTNNRLLKPVFAANNLNCNAPSGGQAQQYIDSGLPLDYFLSNTIDAVPSRKMLARIILRKRLQALTTIVQPGQASLNRTAYKNLPVPDDPSWWHDTRPGNANSLLPNGRVIHEIDGLTHRGFMEVEFGDPTQFAGVAARNKTRGT